MPNLSPMSNELILPSGEVLPRQRRGGWRMWALAILVGLMAACAVVFMRTLISYGQFIAFGAPRGRLASHLPELAWWRVMLGPIVGGCLIALLLRLGTSWGWGPRPRAFGLSDVVATRRLRGAIRATTLSLRDSFLSALIAVISLGWGASGGRESPSAHIGASLAILPGRLLGLDLPARRMLAAMGVAAAIAAALHAPIAAVFLARELILPRQRLATLGPIALASVSGWLFARDLIGDLPVLDIPAAGAIPPAYYLALIAIAPLLAAFGWWARYIWVRAPELAEDGAARFHIPLWILPAIGGVLIGIVALAFPQVISIGYEPLSAGLGGGYSALLMPVLALAKIAATAISQACRFGGGPIAPALYIGAMMGSAMGAAVGLALGGPASAQVYFGVIGMAIVLAILLDAPVTAGILALELSGSPEIGAAALVSAFLAVLAVRRFTPAAEGDPDTRNPLHWR
jgi:chloride channel protein, CIC family